MKEARFGGDEDFLVFGNGVPLDNETPGRSQKKSVQRTKSVKNIQNGYKNVK